MRFTWPCCSAFKGVEIGARRKIQTRTDCFDIVLRRQPKCFYLMAFCTFRRYGPNALNTNRGGCNDGAKRFVLRRSLPILKHLDSKVLIVRIDLLAVDSTEPNAVRLVTPLISGEGVIIAGAVW